MVRKRFTLTFEDNINDNLTGITHNIHSGYGVAMDLTELLNELHEENQELKAENEAQFRSIMRLSEKINDCRRILDD